MSTSSAGRHNKHTADDTEHQHDDEQMSEQMKHREKRNVRKAVLGIYAVKCTMILLAYYYYHYG